MVGRMGVIELIPIALLFVMVIGPVPFGLAGAFMAGVEQATASAPLD